MNDKNESELRSVITTVVEHQIHENDARGIAGTVSYITAKCEEYAAFLELPAIDIFVALEQKRFSDLSDYYREKYQPSLNDDHVVVFDDLADLSSKIRNEQGFICPSCSGISGSCYECDCVNDNGDNCNFSVYNSTTLGKGIKVTTKKSFLKAPRFDEIFMPVSMQHVFK